MSGLAVLDVDSGKHAEAGEWYEQNKRRLPITRAHRTLSSGLHRIYRWRDGFRSTQGHIATGIDTRGSTNAGKDGGYFIWWPHYLKYTPDAVPIADAPDWLIEALKPNPPPPRPARAPAADGDYRWLRGLARTVMNAQEGQRNATLFWAACRAAEHGGDQFAKDVLIDAALRVGLDQRGAAATINSGLRTAGVLS
jgi:hypothetical protein